MAIKVKLAHKGIVIIALPVLLQIGSYVWLKEQLSQAEERARRQETAKKIVSRVNLVIMHSAEMFDVLVQYYLTKDGKAAGQLDEAEQDARKRLQDVCNLLRVDARQPAEAQRVSLLGEQFLREVEKSRQMIAAQDTVGTSIAREFSMSYMFRMSAKNLCDELYALARRMESDVMEEGQHEAKKRIELTQWIGYAVALNAVFAVGMIVFFMQGTVRHLGVLKANARRLASNQPLLEVVDSTDEVGEVDRVFHEMARALTDAQRTLELSEERLKSVIEALPVALIVTDENGRIESLNPTAETLFEYRSKKLVGKNISTLLADKSKESDARPLIQRLHEEASVRPLITEGISSELERIPVEVSVSSFEYSTGKRMLATIVDITERYKLERLKRDFVAMVSHDIRTPLSSIRGILEITREGRLGPVSEDAQHKLAMAEENASRLLQMVKSLLDLEKLDAGLVDLSFADFSVQSLFETAKGLVEQYAQEQSVTLDIAHSNLVASGDADSLGQVLVNLLSNAIRYSPSGAKVAVSASEVEGGIRIEVADEGPGVPKRQQGEIFERFKQSNVKRDKSKGFGLGLAICKSIVTQHGHQIGVESQDGAGSVFWFTVAKARVGNPLPVQSE
jgi:PAS domain S-box-containing protein